MDKNKLREAFAARLAGPLPGVRPVGPFPVPALKTRPVTFSWEESWEGDGWRPGDNVRTRTVKETHHVLEDPEDPAAREWVREMAEYATGTREFAEEDFARFAERAKLQKLLGPELFSGEEIMAYPEQTMNLEALEYCHARQAAERQWDFTLRAWETKREAFFCSRLESEGGLVRLVDGLPVVPVEDHEGYPTTSRVELRDGKWRLPEYSGRLTTWENLEDFLSEGGYID